MDPNCRVEIRISRPHHSRHGAAGRETRHEDAGRIDIVGGNNVLSDAGNDGWLTRPAYLVLRHEPIPAQGCVCCLGLARIGNQQSMLLSEIVHACASREVVSILHATMQHHDQTSPANCVTTRNIKLVAAAAGGAGKGAADELSTLCDLQCLAGLKTRQGIKIEAVKIALSECPD